VDACNKLQGQYTSGPCSVSQKAAEAAYTGTQQPVKDMCQAFRRRRDLTCDLLKKIEGVKINVPDGAFYLFPDMSYYLGKSFGDKKMESGANLAMYLLEEGHVATVGGNAFGAPTCIRLSYAAADEQLVEAVKRIETSLKRLK